MSDRPVIVFDSGIGGLTVLRELRVVMPDRRFLYVADDAGFPYGDWEEAALVERIVALFDDLLTEHDPALAVIACNTASTLVMPALRARFSIPFVGTVPAIKPAAERTRSGLVSVLATPGTVRRDYTRGLIDQFARECHVRLVGSARLAPMAEHFLRTGTVDPEELLAEAGDCFLEQAGRRTDIVVLACTHYPFLANALRKVAPWPVDWLDPAEAIARQALKLLPEPPATLPEGFDRVIFTSGSADHATRRLLHGFGLETAA
ncbi:glutamate racemase [Aurantimonas sp. MSK8Z-1]|uniref:glutamate racemase n=1 Tax=Mangrovibrevibacter kandeliae TaxID=2968473 RepID=UPI0021188C5B|nr:glutamate racemase [Aurantimonas sp. MSK8Z-1]MCW4114424.1 glutamate racemase [Aurantimonas sp. MSK8Z-1]